MYNVCKYTEDISINWLHNDIDVILFFLNAMHILDHKKMNISA